MTWTSQWVAEPCHRPPGFWQSMVSSASKLQGARSLLKMEVCWGTPTGLQESLCRPCVRTSAVPCCVTVRGVGPSPKIRRYFPAALTTIPNFCFAWRTLALEASDLRRAVNGATEMGLSSPASVTFAGLIKAAVSNTDVFVGATVEGLAGSKPQDLGLQLVLRYGTTALFGPWRWHCSARRQQRNAGRASGSPGRAVSGYSGPAQCWWTIQLHRGTVSADLALQA